MSERCAVIGVGQTKHDSKRIDVSQVGLVREAGVEVPVGLDADGLVPVVRRSRQGGWLIFLLNLECSPVRTALCPGWESPRLHDLIEGREVTAKAEGSFEIEVGPWEVGVFYSEE